MKRFTFIGMVFVFALAACGGASTASPAGGSGLTAEANGNAPATQESAGENSNTNGASTDSTPSSGASGECTLDSASFVSDVTIEENAILQPGQKFTKTWLVKNSGNCTWSDQYHFVFANGDQMDASEATPLQGAIPGNTVEISVNLKAPDAEDETRAHAEFEIHNVDGTPIAIDGGTTLWVSIRIANGEAPKGNTSAASGPGYANATCGYTTDDSRIAQLFEALNKYRAENGVEPYLLNASLSEAAQAHAADMACNNLFYHNGSNGSTATSRVAASGYLASYVTENVYGSWPPLSPADAIQWWANDATDPRHNENLLSTRYLEVGIGYAFFNNFGYYVLDFAVPQ